jgi:hypothetical protein
MAFGYKPKNEVDLAWNAIKQVVNAKVNMEVAIYRERRKNDLLSEIWPQFKDALTSGEILELETESSNWVRDALQTVDINEIKSK